MADLTNEQVMDSYSAVRSFLQEKSLNPVNRNVINCNIRIGRQNSYNDDFECIDHQMTYILHSDTFKANRYYKPVWSAYHLFIWDKISRELSVEIENKKYIIKHKL